MGEMTQQFTAAQLQEYNGTGADGKIYISLGGTVYDVTAGRDFYGPGAGSYHVFAGKEASRALGIMSLKPEDCTADLTGLTEAQLKTLDDWKKKFAAKYPVVGTLIG